MQAPCEIFASECTTQSFDGQTNLATPALPSFPKVRRSVTNIAVIGLATKPALRPAYEEVVPSAEFNCDCNFHKHFQRSTVSSASLTVN
jgi:hypothetical protein